VWPHPVELEPPFLPFRLPSDQEPTADDARKTTAIGGWLTNLLQRRGSIPELPPDEPEDPEPFPASDHMLVEFQVALPPDAKVTTDSAEHFLLSLSSCRHPVSFEIIATHDSVTVQFTASEQDAVQIRNQLLAYFPEAAVSEKPGHLESVWNHSVDSVLVDFGLSQEFMQPLRTISKLDVDPLIAIVGAMADLSPGEVVVYQVMLQAVSAPWRDSILRATSTWDGDDFFVDAPELLPLAKDKISRPLYAVVLRLAAQSERGGRSWALARAFGGALAQLEDPNSNQLIALDNDDYPHDAHVADILARRSRRSGMIVNSQELVTLVHPPSSSVRSARLTRHSFRTKAAPATVNRNGLVIGNNEHAGQSRPIALSEEQRLRHTHIVGVSGTGKSTLLMQMLVQDMGQGHGLAVLDPHGDLIDELLCRVPGNRQDDVVLVDPADLERPVPFNILAAHSELEKTLLASDLVAVFRRLSTSWGDQMTSVLSNAVLAFLESTRGGSLADLRRFLIEPDYRRDFLATVTDPEVVYFWQKEFPLLVGRPQAPLLTRLDSFLRPKTVRRMVAQKQSLDFADVMNGGRILLVKLSQGSIGEENAALLGSLFVSKIQQTAIARQAVPEPERRPFFCYIDEFQNFITPSMASMLTGARKYRVGLILAHQELRQLWNQDKDVASAVLANAATRICFRVGGDDAKTLESGFSGFCQSDLQNLGIGQAVCRVDRADWDFSLDTAPMTSATPSGRERAALLVARSRERYGVAPTSASTDVVVVEPVAASKTVPEAPRAQPRPRTPPSSAVIATDSTPPQAVVPTLPGRGGAQHKYLQALIRRWGEANGWRATVEKSILDGLGSVDVALERDGQSIACEICVTSTAAYEVGNIQKCLAAGFDHIITVVTDRSAFRRVQGAVEATSMTAGVACVEVVLASDVLERLAGLSIVEPAGQVTRGYKVTVSRTQGEGSRSTHSIIARAVVNSLKRFRR